MLETALDYEDFKKRVDRNRPIHYIYDTKPRDRFASEWVVTLVITGLEIKEGWRLRFMVESSTKYKEDTEKEVVALIKEYVRPLKATKGMFEE